jgi:hypothetical protein
MPGEPSEFMSSNMNFPEVKPQSLVDEEDPIKPLIIMEELSLA